MLPSVRINLLSQQKEHGLTQSGKITFDLQMYFSSLGRDMQEATRRKEKAVIMLLKGIQGG